MIAATDTGPGLRAPRVAIPGGRGWPYVCPPFLPCWTFGVRWFGPSHPAFFGAGSGGSCVAAPSYISGGERHGLGRNKGGAMAGQRVLGGIRAFVPGPGHFLRGAA